MAKKLCLNARQMQTDVEKSEKHVSFRHQEIISKLVLKPKPKNQPETSPDYPHPTRGSSICDQNPSQIWFDTMRVPPFLHQKNKVKMEKKYKAPSKRKQKEKINEPILCGFRLSFVSCAAYARHFSIGFP